MPFLSLSNHNLSYVQIMVIQIWVLDIFSNMNKVSPSLKWRRFKSFVANEKIHVFKQKIRSLQDLILSPWALKVSWYLKMRLIMPDFAKIKKGVILTFLENMFTFHKNALFTLICNGFIVIFNELKYF